MKRIRFNPETEAELNDAKAWYELQRPGLGGEFLACVEEVLQRVGREPLQ